MKELKRGPIDSRKCGSMVKKETMGFRAGVRGRDPSTFLGTLRADNQEH